MRLRSLYIVLTALCLLTSIDAHAIPVFTDWTTVDTSANTASGTLNGLAVSLAGFDITFGDTNGTTGFSNAAVFSPALALSDSVEVTGSFTTPFTYTVTFSSPVTDPIMHVASLASTLHFPGITLTKVSGETNFVVSGNDVTGEFLNSNPCCGSDRNGTILLNGTFTSFSFTAQALGLFTNDRDGIGVQIGGTVVQQAIGGSVTGVSPSNGRVACSNLTTRQTVKIPLNSAKSWNCEAEGLVVAPGDEIKQSVTVKGTAD